MHKTHLMSKLRAPAAPYHTHSTRRLRRIVFKRCQVKLFSSLRKDGLLTELQAKMSRGCRFLLFWHHNYWVTLSNRQ